MGVHVAVFDACVLYPAPLRDFLMELSTKDLFRAKWTEQIHDEWIRNVLSNRPDLTREQLDRTRRIMNQAVPDSLIEGYEWLIDDLALPDPDDRHVLAAAIHGRANVIVTFNLRDFPPAALDPHGIEALHPDDFVLSQFDLSMSAVCSAAKTHRARLKKPPKSVDEYLETLARQELAETVQRLRKFADLI